MTRRFEEPDEQVLRQMALDQADGFGDDDDIFGLGELHREGHGPLHTCLNCEALYIGDQLEELMKRMDALEAKGESDGHQDRDSRDTDQSEPGNPGT